MSRYPIATADHAAPSEARPVTELESIRDQVEGRSRLATDILVRLEAMANKLRGGATQSNAPVPTPIPCGLLSEIRQILQETDRVQGATLDLLIELSAIV